MRIWWKGLKVSLGMVVVLVVFLICLRLVGRWGDLIMLFLLRFQFFLVFRRLFRVCCVWLICSFYCFYWLFLVCRFGGLGGRIEVVGVLVVGWVQCLIVLFFSVFQGSGLLSGQYIGELRVRRRRRMLVWMNKIVWEYVLRMQSIFIFCWSLMMMILF